jgi:endonuclease III
MRDAHPKTLRKGVTPLVELRRRARHATKLLAKTYGSPDHNNKKDPLDELVFIVLSQMTTAPSFERVYLRLRALAPRWDDVLNMPMRKFKRAIKDAGLSNQKAPRLKSIFAHLKKDFGAVSLAFLADMQTKEAEDYLVTLPGVQRKTAKCVLMYSLGRAVLPVDTHVLRVARRLGLTKAHTVGDQVHVSLEEIVPDKYRYDFHVNALSHGRAVCLAKAPRCSVCVLSRICPYPSNLPRP